jgi:protein TilB
VAGKWEYRLEESGDGRALLLDVAFGRFLDTSAIQADVQPTYVRLLAKGRLLQLHLPAEVAPDASVAQRSRVTGNLLVTMPLASRRIGLRAMAAKLAGTPHSGATENAQSVGNSPGQGRASSKGRSGRAAELASELPPAVLSAAGSTGGTQALCDDDELPPL